MKFQIIDNFFDESQCDELILSESLGYFDADISYSSGSKMNSEYRNNQRCLYWNEQLALKIQAMMLYSIPEKLSYLGEDREFLSVSSNFRFYKYLPGHFFKQHRDENHLSDGKVDLATILIYLNTVKDSGYTNLIDDGKIGVQPVKGRLLMFNHTVKHEGEILKDGTKYVLRTDLLYKI